ncbi:cell division protein FtsB [Parapusillimonas granuli]|uniref:Cell division protein FtsB n=1 Tax=Parapusillimonas granuli TaxID=380911 RepID=A0A853FRF6_9BURK|nr:cell division protein FtsB [Parapusillimonas granuli]MBB5213586.1 cell division protein FtsB [Parapusillimonas granuli]MEB2398679.1 cell division protein FtsB [Alcaligenaceae bacterium]NYT48424.1 cell division protein FtsB [Parapusillimonas granuli]
MRLLLIILVLLTAITQYALWWGKGGWLRVQELERKIATQQETNEALMARNNALQAEVQDLKSGTAAIEERARSELGMVKDGEIYVQILAPNEKEPEIKPPPKRGPAAKAPAKPRPAPEHR